jgi:hypothetical protein
MDEVYSRANLTAVAARKERKEMEAARFSAALEAWKTKWVTAVELAAADGRFPDVTLFMAIEPTSEFLDGLETARYQVNYATWDEVDCYGHTIHGWKLYLKERPVPAH